MTDRGWTADDLPDQRGRTAVVTGANTGLGFETAAALAAHGASVVLAVRNVAGGEDAVSVRGAARRGVHHAGVVDQ